MLRAVLKVFAVRVRTEEGRILRKDRSNISPVLRALLTGFNILCWLYDAFTVILSVYCHVTSFLGKFIESRINMERSPTLNSGLKFCVAERCHDAVLGSLGYVMCAVICTKKYCSLRYGTTLQWNGEIYRFTARNGELNLCDATYL